MFTSETKSIIAAIEKLQALCQADVQGSWQYSEVDFSVDEVLGGDISNWEMARCNQKGQIAWDKGRKVVWLAQKFVVPEFLQPSYPLQGLSLRLALVWWADRVQVYVDGQLGAEGDLFDFSPRVLLSSAVKPGDSFIVALRLVSPGHDIGALMRSRLIYEPLVTDAADVMDAGFLAAEIAVVQKFLETFAPEELPGLAAIVEELTNRKDAEDTEGEKEKEDYVNLKSKIRLEKFAPDETDSSNFLQKLKSIIQNLKSIIHNPKSKIQNLKSKIYLLGHAHLDMAWLWSVEETWRAAQNTFESVLKLQEDFPDLIFCHSTPALYEWVEQNRPDLFAKIQAQVKAGKWEVLGGFWVEPDLNLISGESIVRQLLYGQQYTQAKFGKISPIVWVPDTFGFAWTLPQFMQQAGIEFFVTQKLRWNDTNKFPYGAFWWRSPDGSEVFSYMSGLIGEGIDPVKMGAYSCEWQTQTSIADALWLPGVGDHGGGPTRDMLEIAQRWQKSEVFPDLEFITAENYLRQIKDGEWGVGSGELEMVPENSTSIPTSSQLPPPNLQTESIPPVNQSWRWETRRRELLNPEGASSPDSLFPKWNDELYLEFHRGCYTTHGQQKRFNRKSENLLYEAELFAAWATIGCGVEYPKAELETAWKKLLFNQFHDILPGSSITEVYRDALLEWQFVEAVGSKILQDSLREIALQAPLPTPPHVEAKPIFVFNSLNWVRSEVVAVDFPESLTNAFICSFDGQTIPSQLSEPSTLLFLADNIPSVGYRIFWLCGSQSQQDGSTTNCQDPISTTTQNIEILSPKKFILENEYLRVTVDETTGDLNSIFDLVNQKEILSGAGNQLQAFQDSGQYWDAWNIDPNYAQHPLPPTQLKSIQLLDQGAIQNRLRVIRQIGKSEFYQDYILEKASPMLKIATHVDWQERHVLVKVAFPLVVESDFATYEIPCGAINRTTKPQTPEEKAKWELPAMRWADLTQEIRNGENLPLRGSTVSYDGKPISRTDSPGGYSLQQSTPTLTVELEMGNDLPLYSSYGISLLNDCKYGYDAMPNQLRLTLLRSPEWPDPEADKGLHQFTYAVYPHTGSWEEAQTVRRGYELNIPLQAIVCQDVDNPKRSNIAHPNLIQDGVSFLSLSADNLVIMAFKQAEDNPSSWILRCYECNGKSAEVRFQSDLGCSLDEPVDLLERAVVTPSFSFNQHNFTIAPWKVTSFKVS